MKAALFTLVALLGAVSGLAGEVRPPAHAFAVTVNPLATEAALEAMRAGGNAVDGTIAAALTLAVVDGHNSGLGGGIFLLVRSPDGALTALDGRETAPAAATRDMFLRDGRADPKLSQTGALAAGVPGELAALDATARQFARLPLRHHFAKAATLAESGFVPDAHYEARLRDTRRDLQRFPDSAAVFFAPRVDGKLRQPDLARTLRALAEYGIDWFYLGPFAEKTAAWMKANGGLLTWNDFHVYRVERREPLRTTYRGYEIVGFPPPSSGGVHVAQLLNILEGFDLAAMGDRSATFAHLLAEAMKLAFADRAHWLGDPTFARVPRGLAGKPYALELARRINHDQATPVPTHGEPPAAESDVFSKHTTHFSVADSDGWWVAATATINTSFGSKVVVPGTGIVLNNQMDDFSAQPGTPNAFALVGAEANAVAPGKRPLSSMSPTLVLSGGRPLASLGAAGGPTIITQVVAALVRTLDFHQPPAEALAGPRLHQQWRPDELRLEATWPPAVRADLEKRGHHLEVVNSLGAAQMIGVASDGRFLGAADPRGSGKAAGF